MPNSELSACPFCGGDAVIKGQLLTTHSSATCTNCLATGPIIGFKEYSDSFDANRVTIAKEWNRRELDPLAVKELVEAAGNLMESYASAMSSEYDFPDNPWTPERDNDIAYIELRKALSKFDPPITATEVNERMGGK